MARTFSAQVGAWAQKVEGAVEAVFKASAQELVSQMDDLLTSMVYDTPPSPNYRRTGFLRASLMASTSAMPRLVRDNPGAAIPHDLGPVILVINDAELGDTLFLGYTASYAAYVHFGARGQAPRPWVNLVAQRWKSIVADQAKAVRARVGH